MTNENDSNSMIQAIPTMGRKIPIYLTPVQPGDTEFDPKGEFKPQELTSNEEDVADNRDEHRSLRVEASEIDPSIKKVYVDGHTLPFYVIPQRLEDLGINLQEVFKDMVVFFGSNEDDDNDE